MNPSHLLRCLSSLLCLLSISCSADMPEPRDTLSWLQHEKGWYAYAFARTEGNDTLVFQEEAPYLILGEYGNSFSLQADGRCTLYYSDGSAPLGQGQLELQWELIDEQQKLRFFKPASGDSLRVQIVEIQKDHLWLRHPFGRYQLDYKMRPME